MKDKMRATLIKALIFLMVVQVILIAYGVKCIVEGDAFFGVSIITLNIIFFARNIQTLMNL